MNGQATERFSSGVYAVIALFGFTLSFGAIWKFPYISAMNGAGSFLVFYVFCLVIFAIPLQMAALAIGRRGRGDPVAAVRAVCEQDGRSSFWLLIGGITLLAGFIVLSYFSVISGWLISFLILIGGGELQLSPVARVDTAFGELLDNWPFMLAGHSIFMAMTIIPSALGPRRGLQPVFVGCAVTVLITLIVLFAVALIEGAVLDSFRFQFFSFGHLGWPGTLTAIGQAFFVAGVGSGAVLALGAHLPTTTSITKVSIFSALLVLAISCFAGVMMYAFVFASGLDPGMGPQLFFFTLPEAFSNFNNGTVYYSLFLILMLVIAWGTSIAFMEPLAMYASRVLGLPRPVAAIVSGLVVWAFGLLSVFSFSLLSDSTILNRTVFDILDYLASNILIPLGALLTALFAAWGISRHVIDGELRLRAAFPLWQVLTGVFAAIAIIATVVNVFTF